MRALPHPRAVVALTAAALLVIGVGPAAADASSPSGVPSPGKDSIGTAIRTRTLSNEVTVTRWAFARRAAPIRRGPHSRSRTEGRLNFLTSDGRALPYIALRSETRGRHGSWTKVRVPARPNGETGWVKSSALGRLRTARGRLVINRERFRATLYNGNNKVRWRARVGVGRPGLATPKGHFWITERLRSIGGPDYGPFAFGTSAYAPHLTDWPGGGVVGIHGTDQPGLIPGRPSHGCIRLRNQAVRKLWRKLEIGTPVRIR